MKCSLEIKPGKNELAVIKKLLAGELIYASMFVKGNQKYLDFTPKERKVYLSIINSCDRLLSFTGGAGSRGFYSLNETGKKVFADLTKKVFTVNYVV